MLLSPTWLLLGGLLLLPLAGIVWLSFHRADAFGDPVPIDGLSGFWQLLRSGDWWAQYADAYRQDAGRVFWRSLWMAALTTVLTGIISFPLAYFLALKAPPRLKSLLVLLAVVPFWTSFVIRTYAWMFILRREGLLTAALRGLGLIEEPVDLLYTNWAVLVGLVYGELPFMILPLYASMEKIDRSLLEAAADLGGNALSAVRRVVLPLSAPGLVAGAVLVFVPAVGQFIVSDMLGGAKVALVGNLIENQFLPKGSVGNRPFGAAVTVQLIGLVLFLVWLYTWWSKRKREDVSLV